MSQVAPVILYRILGNDLPPRYTPGQTLATLQFILEQEQELPGLEKRWLLNRIVDPRLQAELKRTIHSAGHRCDEIPFRAEEYRRTWTDPGAIPPQCHPWNPTFQELSPLEQARISDYIGRAKNLYLMNNNAARNRALELGFAEADWVLPWDGGCFLPAWAWPELQQAMQHPDQSYVCIPMHRLPASSPLPTASERDRLEPVEPQLGIARWAALRFDKQLRYGSGPKWQLLRRIGLPGPWQEGVGWLPWEVVDSRPAVDAGRWRQAGLVLRLSDGQQDARHQDEQALWSLRFAGIRRFTRQVDLEVSRECLRRHPYRCWSALRRAACAPEPLTLATSPSWQADLSAASPSWQAVPLGRLARLSLAMRRHRHHAELPAALRQELQQGLAVLQRWFLDPSTALKPEALGRLETMRPQQGMGPLVGIGALLDAFTALQQAGALGREAEQQLRLWARHLLDWLTDQPQGFLWQHRHTAALLWYHHVLLVLAAYLEAGMVHGQVIDNLPGLLACQLDRDRDPQVPRQAAEQRDRQQAWAALAESCTALGRDLHRLLQTAEPKRSGRRDDL
ncbi:MAG: hypothetical protein ACKOXO_12595 [Cyanobium sp.]